MRSNKTVITSHPQLKFLWLILIFVWSSFSINSSHAQQLPFAELDIADGLEDMVVFDMDQDDLGFLWITTRTGVNRFDGTRFETYKKSDGLPHNLVRDLLKDRHGILWAGSESGLARFNGKSFEQVLTDQWPEHVSVRMVKAGAEDTLWVATYGMGILKIDTASSVPRIEQQFNRQTGFPSDRIRSLMVAEDGSIWAGDSAHVYHITEGDTKIINWEASSSEIRYLYQHTDQSIWAGTREGIAYFTGDSFVQKQFNVDLSDLTINSINRANDGHVWVSTRDNGAFQFDAEDLLIQHLNMSNGLPDNSVNSIFHDSEQNLWLGTYGGGLARLSTSDVINWKSQAVMPNPNVYIITNDQQGCIWVGTNGDGVTSFCENVTTHITTADGLAHNKVLSGLIDQDGNPWFGTLQGVSYLKDGQFINFDESDGLTGLVVYHMAYGQDGSIWLATNNGLNHYQDGQFSAYFESDGLPDNRINMVIQAQDGSLWLGTSNGLSHYRDGKFTNWTNDDGLAANFINDIYEDANGQLWLATNNGLSLFDGQHFRTWTVDDGLPHNNATTILPGKEGEIWIGTSRGVAIYDAESFTVITSREGLVFDLVNRSAGYKDNEGNLWFGTGAGISRFAKGFEPGSTSPPPVHILEIHNETEKLANHSTPLLEQQNSSLTISYTAISFQRAPDISYRYRMNKKQENIPWRETRLNELQIDSLAAGEYQFQVTAKIGNGLWNPTPAVFNFKVTPPFWETPWFMVLVLMLLMVAWFYRSWRSKQHALKLEAIVHERTKQLKKVNHGLDWLAHHDSLTKLSNRHHIKEVLGGIKTPDSAIPLGVLLIDLDHFKNVNDRYGHAVGDKVLQTVANMLQKVIPENHTVARWGGEEFIVLCPKARLVEIQKLVQDLLHGCQQIEVSVEAEQTIHIKCSIGFTYLSKLLDQENLGKQIENSIQLADIALYQAKEQGRNQACGYLIKQAIDESTLKGYIAETTQAIADGHITVTAIK